MTTPAAPAGIEHERRRLYTYTNLAWADADVYRPKDVGELREIFAYAQSSGRRVTLRAGGHSFDEQALNTDLIVCMRRFDTICVHPEERKVSVGPGARWGDILRALLAYDLLPAVTVTTEHATAGGTLAGDCLSRFSPAYGKEGTWVESFDLLLPAGGAPVHCTPPPAHLPPAQWTWPEHLFVGAVGGLGYLGAFVRITYRALYVGKARRIRTRVQKYTSFEHLAEDLVPTVGRTHVEKSDPQKPEMLDAIYSALYDDGRDRQEALLLTSTLVESGGRRSLVLYRPRLIRRVVTEWLIRIVALNRLLWWLGFRFLFRERVDYVNDLEGYTFFMDGNARSKQAARRWLRRRLKTLQQTFVVPGDPDRPHDWEQAQKRLVDWLGHAHEVFAQHRLTPTLHDVLFLPRDLPFRLSATADLPGFAVSYAFETNDEDTLTAARHAFSALADDLWECYGGRVYLVKNVCARQETLAAMYGDNARAFRELKRQVDPRNVLANEFLGRILGGVA